MESKAMIRQALRRKEKRKNEVLCETALVRPCAVFV